MYFSDFQEKSTKIYLELTRDNLGKEIDARFRHKED